MPYYFITAPPSLSLITSFDIPPLGQICHADEIYQEVVFPVTRPDTRLPMSRAGGQGPYLRSVEHLGRSGIAKNPINAEKVKCDGRMDRQTDGPTDGPTKRGLESCARD